LSIKARWREAIVDMIACQMIIIIANFQILSRGICLFFERNNNQFYSLIYYHLDTGHCFQRV